jgi:hypothetical protein
MKISKDDVIDVGKWSVAGLSTGLVYSMVSIWIKQKTNTQDLDPKTEALFNDSELYSLFTQLQRFRFLDETAFRRCVDNADRLLYRRMQLQDTDIEASLSDRPEAFMYLKNAMNEIEKILDKSKNHPEARIPVEIHRLYIKIYESLESHWKAVLKLTQAVTESI